MMQSLFLLFCLACTVLSLVEGLANVPQSKGKKVAEFRGVDSSYRRFLLASSVGALLIPTKSDAARLVLNDDGEYDEVEDTDWQTAWKQRLDKAQSMSTDEVFMAARGAGNTNLREGPESDASKKRRAMAGCRDTGLRTKSGVSDSKACSARVLDGDFDFMLNVM